MLASEINLFQVAYDAASREKVSYSGFLMLYKLGNERPDWYEYWPIRKYLLTPAEFSDKSPLGPTEMRDFVAAADE